MSLARESRVPIRTESSDIELRKGKWTVEEENYANKIISLFNQGMLPVVAGTTLRTYLSDKLRCDPMRITKKYAGASCIGKQVFQLCDNYYECFQENERELQRLENLFLIRINGKGGGGLSGKRGAGTGEVPVPHQSIYETSNLDATPINPVSNHTATKRPYKTNRRGSGSKNADKEQLGGGFGMLGGSPRLVNYRHSAEQAPGFSPQYDTYRSSGSDGYEDHSADDEYYEQGGDETGFAGRGSGGSRAGLGARLSEQHEDDYGYAYDPDGDAESAQHHAQQQQALRQYQAYEELMRSQQAQQALQQQHQQGNAAPTQSGFYNSLQAGGRRVLSAPNLTELNLSSWKATDYRPLPADSLKEMFSLPMHDHHHTLGHGAQGGVYPHAAYGAGGAEYSGAVNGGSLLPEHVYSAIGNESGRYASHGHSRGGAGGLGMGLGMHGSSAAMMAARARATKQALQQHQQELQQQAAYPSSTYPHSAYPYPHSGAMNRGEGRAVDDAAGLLGGHNHMNNKLRMKRSHSAMALMDFEKLAGDDTAAGDFFLQFLNKVSGTSNTNTPRRDPKEEPHSVDATTAGAPAVVSSTGVAQLVMEEGDIADQVERSRLSAPDVNGKVAVLSPAVPVVSSVHAYVPVVTADTATEVAVEVDVEVEAVEVDKQYSASVETAMDLS